MPTPLSLFIPSVLVTSTKHSLHSTNFTKRASPINARTFPKATLKDYTTPTYTSTPLEDYLLSIKYDDLPTFTTLLSQLGPNVTWPDRANQSALLAACFRGRTRMIEMLIQSGADCSHRNDYGVGAVAYVVKWYQSLRMYEEGERIVKMLVENGATDGYLWKGG